MKTQLLVGLIISVLCVSVSFAAEPIGKILALEGKATAVSQDGQQRNLEIKSPVYLNDKISTAEGSKIQISFNDDSVISQGEKSEMLVDEYVFSPNKKDDNSCSVKVMKGMFRVITGKITKLNPERFRVRTKMATIGIRGCDVGFVVTEKSANVYVISLKGQESITVRVRSGQGGGQVGGGEWDGLVAGKWDDPDTAKQHLVNVTKDNRIVSITQGEGTATERPLTQQELAVLVEAVTPESAPGTGSQPGTGTGTGTEGEAGTGTGTSDSSSGEGTTSSGDGTTTGEMATEGTSDGTGTTTGTGDGTTTGTGTEGGTMPGTGTEGGTTPAGTGTTGMDTTGGGDLAGGGMDLSGGMDGMTDLGGLDTGGGGTTPLETVNDVVTVVQQVSTTENIVTETTGETTTTPTTTTTTPTTTVPTTSPTGVSTFSGMGSGSSGWSWGRWEIDGMLDRVEVSGSAMSVGDFQAIAATYNLYGAGDAAAVLQGSGGKVLVQGSCDLYVTVGGGAFPNWNGSFNMSSGSDMLSFMASGKINSSGSLLGETLQTYSMQVGGASFGRGHVTGWGLSGSLLGPPGAPRPTGAIGDYNFNAFNGSQSGSASGIFGTDLN